VHNCAAPFTSHGNVPNYGQPNPHNFDFLPVLLCRQDHISSTSGHRTPLDIIVLGILFDQDINLLDIYFYLSVGYPDTNNLDFTYFVRKMALKNFK
jgi:hypothetical protein